MDLNGWDDEICCFATFVEDVVGFDVTAGDGIRLLVVDDMLTSKLSDSVSLGS